VQLAGQIVIATGGGAGVQQFGPIDRLTDLMSSSETVS
jgi:hypothetical protein